ncbi:MAG: hypothetical protein ACPH2K_03175, partial [Flavicella sp.]
MIINTINKKGMLEKKKVSRCIVSLLFYMLPYVVVYGQDVVPLTWSRDFRIKTFPGVNANDDIGLKTSGTSDAGENIFCNVYINEIYDPSNENNSYIYGFKARPNSEGGFDNIPYVREEPRRKFWSHLQDLLETDAIQYYVNYFSSNSLFVLRKSLMALLKHHITGWADDSEPNAKRPRLSTESNPQSTVHVTVTAAADGSTDNTLSLAGFGIDQEIDVRTFNPNYPDLEIFVYRDGTILNDEPLEFRLNPQPGQPANPPLDLVLGDSVVFRSKHLRHEIQDLPEVWIARSSGESKYYCTKRRRLITKNTSDPEAAELFMPKLKPFIGFDFNGNSIITRSYEQGKEYKELSKISTDGLHEFSWIAQRRMDASK